MKKSRFTIARSSSHSSASKRENVIDNFNQEVPGIEMDFSLPSGRVIRTLTQIIDSHGKQTTIRCDNGLEYLSTAIVTQAHMVLN